jgi:general secretion pathway protein E/type IV pilus assembly protein PilB
MITTNEVRQLAHDRASSWKVMKAAVEQGMLTLRQDGWRKAARGVTSIEEVHRNAKLDVALLKH